MIAVVPPKPYNTLTHAEAKILRHTLGIGAGADLPGTWNQIAAPRLSDALRRLIRRGLMEPSRLVDGVYYATIQGAHAVGLPAAGFRRAFTAGYLRAHAEAGWVTVAQLIRTREPWPVVERDEEVSS